MFLSCKSESSRVPGMTHFAILGCSSPGIGVMKNDALEVSKSMRHNPLAQDILEDAPDTCRGAEAAVIYQLMMGIT